MINAPRRKKGRRGACVRIPFRQDLHIPNPSLAQPQTDNALGVAVDRSIGPVT